MRPTSRILALAVLLGSCVEYDLNKGTVEPELGPGTAPDIEVDHTELDFGLVPPQCASSEVLIVRNVGDADLVISDIVLLGGTAFTQVEGPMVLAPAAEATLTIDFLPDDAAGFADVLQVHSNDPDESLVQVSLLGEGSGSGQVEEVYDQLGSASPVDILFVIDNSTSMGDENNALQNNFNTFIQGFLTLGLDFQIGVVTTDMQTAGYQGEIQGPIITTATANPVQQFNLNTNIPFTQVMEEQGFDAVQAALTAPLINGVNTGLVRPGSLLSVIVISDEDDQSVATTTEMISLLDGYQGDPALTSLSIVGGPVSGIWPCGGFLFGAAPVPRYWEVAQATGGIHLNLCQLNMSAIVQQLAVVAAGLATEFPLATLPDDPAAITVLVDGTPAVSDPTDGWTYDAASNSVVFAGSGIPGAGSEIRVQIPSAGACPPI